MKISTIHNNLSLILENKEVLNEPSLYLGNNWKSVLNFWFYLDNLNEHIQQKILEFDKYEFYNADILKYVDDIGHIVPQEEGYIWDAVYMNRENISLNWYYAWASLEIFGHDKILKNDLELKFLPLFLPTNIEINNFTTVDYFSELCNSVEQIQLLLSTPTRVF